MSWLGGESDGSRAKVIGEWCYGNGGFRRFSGFCVVGIFDLKVGFHGDCLKMLRVVDLELRDDDELYCGFRCGSRSYAVKELMLLCFLEDIHGR